MYLHAVLVGNNISAGGPGVCSQHHAVLKNDATDGGTGLFSLGNVNKPLFVQKSIPIIIILEGSRVWQIAKK
jgi:hypothetical protein